MWRWGLLGLVTLLVLSVTPIVGFAQEVEPPLVIFIEDDQLQTASVLDSGPDGLTTLEQIFQVQGARTQWLGLAEPLPEDARVVVLVRPLRALPVDYLARLWAHIARGNHLLLAIDPIGLPTEMPERTQPSNPDRANSGLATLLSLVYGIGLQDTFVAESWFTNASITSQVAAYLQTQPEAVVHHPIVEPLISYDLPVRVWGARSMTVEPIGVASRAAPLLVTDSAYGETNAKVFDTRNEPAPMEINLGQDVLGRLLVGAVGENTYLNSRVVVLGDSEILQNGYGLGNYGGTQDLLHVGDRILTERIVAWLLETSVEEWPSLPSRYTWMRIDGIAEEWADVDPLMVDEAGDSLTSGFDIAEVKAFRDDSYLYLLVELDGEVNTSARTALGIENTYDGRIDLMIYLDAQKILVQSVGSEETITLYRGNFAAGEAFEARIPISVLGEGALLGQVCTANSRAALTSGYADCKEQPPAIIPVVQTLAPLDVANPSGPQVTISSPETGVNLRARPGTDAPILNAVYNGQVLELIGRNAVGDWLQVQNMRYVGWISAPLARANMDVMLLPVTE